ncbi:hypothetical protein Gorai_021924, partial [Gossypium raimondii]|nr:hypothetical protein [Gossypium raimondii]
PLVSQILINGQSQKVEYESLSTICFHCGRYDHVENFCTFRNYGPFVEKKIDSLETIPKNQYMVMDELVKKDENCGPWMIVKRKSRRKFRDNVQKSLGNQERKKEGSHFRILNNRDLNKEVYNGDLSDSRRSKGKVIINGPGSVGSAWSGISGPANGSLAYYSALTIDVGDKDEVAVEVGSLDSGKHSAVVFLESKNTSNKNSAHSLKNTLASNQESMEQLTESISAFSKAKIVSGVLTRTDE